MGKKTTKCHDCNGLGYYTKPGDRCATCRGQGYIITKNDITEAKSSVMNWVKLIAILVIIYLLWNFFAKGGLQ